MIPEMCVECVRGPKFEWRGVPKDSREVLTEHLFVRVVSEFIDLVCAIAHRCMQACVHACVRFGVCSRAWFFGFILETVHAFVYVC